MANDVYQVNVIGSVANEYVENVWHFESSALNSVTPGADAAALLTALQSSVQTPFLACLPDDYELGGYKAKRVNNTGGPSAVLLAGGAAGAIGATSAVSGEGAVITCGYFNSLGPSMRWRTTRIFMPGLPQDAISEGEFRALYIAAVQAFADDLVTPITAGPNTLTYCAYSKAMGHPYAVNPPQVSALVGTQRRRFKPVI